MSTFPFHSARESTGDWKPTAQDERYAVLDILRGLALFGVLLVNDVTFFRVSLFDHILTFHTEAGQANHAVDFLVAAGLEFKAFTLFSWLFGVGLGVQTDRAALREKSIRRFLVRRFLVLLGLGLCHLFLVSNVDVLALYAVCGFLLLPFIRMPASVLAGVGLMAITLSFVWPLTALLPSEAMMKSQAILATHLYPTGGFSQLLILRWQESVGFMLPLLLYVLPRTAGLMLLGMAALRTGLVQHPGQHRRFLLGIAVGGGLVGAVATGLSVWSEATGSPLIAGVPSQLVEAASYIPLAFACAAAVLLWLQMSKSRLLAPVAALGQMALTNYLVQSVVLSLLFYGYGLGLLGRLGSAPAALVGVAIYAVQLGLSTLWLRTFRFGPVEWVWRSLTYGRRQPLRRMSSSTPAYPRRISSVPRERQ